MSVLFFRFFLVASVCGIGFSVGFASRFDDSEWSDRHMVRVPGQVAGGTIYGPGIALTTLRGDSENDQNNNFDCLVKLLEQPEVLKTWGGDRTDSPESIKRFKVRFDQFLERESRDLPGWRAIYEIDSEGKKGAFIGFIAAGFYPDGSIEVAGCIDKLYWKRNYMSRAGMALMGDLMRLSPSCYSQVWWSMAEDNQGTRTISETKLGLKPTVFAPDDLKLPSHYKKKGRCYFRVQNVHDMVSQIWGDGSVPVDSIASSLAVGFVLEESVQGSSAGASSGETPFQTPFLETVRAQGRLYFFEASQGGKRWSFPELLTYVKAQGAGTVSTDSGSMASSSIDTGEGYCHGKGPWDMWNSNSLGMLG